MLHKLLAPDITLQICVYLRITSAYNSYITTPVVGDGKSGEAEKRDMCKVNVLMA